MLPKPLRSTFVGGVTLVALVVTPAHAQLTEDQLITAKENFTAADQDATPGLSSSEFETFVRANAESNIGMSRRIRRFNAFDRAFQRVDGNDDGLVTWEEFVTVTNDG